MELMQEFVTRYVARERRDRWLDLLKDTAKLCKKLSALSHHLGDKARHTDEHAVVLITQFIKDEGAVWLWDFFEDAPVRVTSADAIAPAYFRGTLIVLAEKSRRAIYSYDDQENSVCG